MEKVRAAIDSGLPEECRTDQAAEVHWIRSPMVADHSEPTILRSAFVA